MRFQFNFLVVTLLSSVGVMEARVSSSSIRTVRVVEARVCPPEQIKCGEQCYDPWDATCCGDKLILRGDQLCCNGVILSRGNNEELQCCGSRLYNWRQSRCCSSGHVIPLGAECCLNATNGYISGRDEICCGGNPISVTLGVNACCGGKGYDRNMEKCCTGGGESTLLRMDSAINHGMCCTERTSEYGSIVRSLPYDDRKHICCGGEIVKYTKKCCGTTVMKDNQLCCSSVAVDKQDRHSDTCCYRPSTRTFSTYDSQTQFCDRAGHLHSNVTHEYVTRLQQEVHVCGRVTYNISSDICCRGLLYPRDEDKTACCGLLTYNTDQDLCCKGRIKQGKSKRIYVCCGRNVIPKSHRSQCRDRVRVDTCKKGYDRRRFRCCDGILRRFYSRHERCCGWDIFDNTKEKCCRKHFILPKNKSCRRRERTRKLRRRSNRRGEE